MMTWIVWGGIGLAVVFFVIGSIAQNQEAKDLERGGPVATRFATIVALCTLLNHAKRPGMEDADRLDNERILLTVVAAVSKVFGQAPDNDKMVEDLKTIVQYREAYLEKLKEHSLYKAAKKRCSLEKKDGIILTALIALQLNFQDVDKEANSLSVFAYDFYDNSVEAESRLRGVGSNVNLMELSIRKTNEIIHDMDARTQPQ